MSVVFLIHFCKDKVIFCNAEFIPQAKGDIAKHIAVLQKEVR
jgi:hypothetical protein